MPGKKKSVKIKDLTGKDVSKEKAKSVKGGMLRRPIAMMKLSAECSCTDPACTNTNPSDQWKSASVDI